MVMYKPIQVLFSPSTQRVIWNAGAGISITSVINDGKIVRSVHSAGIDQQEMSKMFSNKDITDWEERIVQTWKELEEQ